MYDCDVLIVGGGPVGVTLALELAQQKVSFRIVDQAPERSDKSRAMIIQPRTLELLNRHGHAQSLLSRGTLTRGLNIVIDNKQTGGISLESVEVDDTEFPLPLGISQADTEKFLDECLATHGAAVERPLAAKAITQDADSVTTTVENTKTGQQETIRSQYVVGCDGAHSFVRHAATNLTFPGAPYDQDFLLCDAHISFTSLPLDRFSLLLGPSGVLMVFPMGNGLVRLITSDAPSPDGDDTLTLAHFQAHLTKFAPPGAGTLSNPVWISRFRLHHRGVNSYRDGRLLLAGDAAHIHSPVGGQGMNTGIQDAVNLGWKLAAVIQHRTANPDKLLDSYDAERKRVGEHLLQTTDQAFSFGVSTNWLFMKVRNLMFQLVMPRLMKGARRRSWYGFLTEFGVTYRKGPIVGASPGWKGIVGKGDRVPDGRVRPVGGGAREETVTVQGICGGRRYCLLVFAGSGGKEKGVEGEEVVKARERVQGAMRDGVEGRFIFREEKDGLPEGSYVDGDGEVHARFGFASGRAGYVLVRPDLYVAHIGHLDQLDELVEFAKGL
ncbi:FAD binding domain-containing protein [Cercophora newfieldiana]|uniref:FAD binding domain-containing protein n=1 Tax=Cercophora newfieldiana TaxID=92897 RepID=A0AA39YHR8_9PEZI|nr:FAD binding domain-containing protein [Cercophora newfieldiana]